MQPQLPPTLITRVLGELLAAIGGEGIAIIRSDASLARDEVISAVGGGTSAILRTIHALLDQTPCTASHGTGLDRRPVLASPVELPTNGRGAVALWRNPESPPWDERDHALAVAVAAIVRVLLEHQARAGGGAEGLIDPLTGLPSRGLFLAELGRHLERLDRDDGSGPLMLVDIDGLKRLNDALGRRAGNEALLLMVARMRAMVRPTDLFARMGGDEFALWLNGMDHLTAAERAEAWRSEPLMPPAQTTPGWRQPLTLSVGIATRRAGSGETIQSLLNRAQLAIRQVKRDGGAHWSVALAAQG